MSRVTPKIGISFPKKSSVLALAIINTTFAKIVLATATLHDVILWVALAIATGLVSAQATSLAGIAVTVLIAIIFLAISLLAMPQLIRFSSGLKYNYLLRSSTSGYVLFVCLLFSAAASVLEVNIVFGALLAGMVIGTMPDDQYANAKEHIRDISLASSFRCILPLLAFAWT